MDRLETLDDGTWPDFLAAPAAVLMLGKSDCEICEAWTGELEGFLAEDADWTSVRFGKMLLDQPGLRAFKKANAWLAEVEQLPMTLVYQDGQRKKDFLGGGIDRLLNRLKRVFGGVAAGG